MENSRNAQVNIAYAKKHYLEFDFVLVEKCTADSGEVRDQYFSSIPYCLLCLDV